MTQLLTLSIKYRSSYVTPFADSIQHYKRRALLCRSNFATVILRLFQILSYDCMHLTPNMNSAENKKAPDLKVVEADQNIRIQSSKTEQSQVMQDARNHVPCINFVLGCIQKE